MVLDLNNHVVVDENKNHFHSNGFATVANGNRVGAVSNISFGRRRQIEQNRRVVDSYRSSNIGNLRNGSFAQPVTSNIPTSNSSNQLPPIQINK